MNIYRIYFACLALTMAIARGDTKSVPYLKIPEGSELAKELAAILGQENLVSGSQLVIEITKEGAEEMPKVPKVPAPKSEGRLNLASYQGKSGTLKNSSQAATRSGGKSRLQVVTLAPVDAITCLERPRLWWYQSADSEAKELEFVLHQIVDGEEAIMTSCKSPALKAGYNKIDLSQSGTNPKGVKLKPDALYRWTINIRSEGGVVPVYAHLKYVKNQFLEGEIGKVKAADATNVSREMVEELSKSLNWHELFDLAATAAKWDDRPELVEVRNRLLVEAGVSKVIEGALTGP